MAKNKPTSSLTQLKGLFLREQGLVLDMGAHTVKVLDVHKKGETVTVNNFLEIENVEKYFNGKDITNIDGLANDVNRVLKITDLKPKKLDLVYNSSQLQTKIIKVPDMSEKDIKEFVDIEYHKSFNGVNSNTHIFDYLPFGTIEEEDRLEHSILIATMPIVESAKLLKAFEMRKMNINAIETNIHALGNALNLVDTESPHKMIVHIGKEYSIVLFSRDNVPVFYRMFAFGYDQLVREIQKEVQTSISNINSMLKTIGFVSDDGFKSDIDQLEYQRIIRESFSTFVNEIYRSINYVKMTTKFEADHLFLSGGVANMEGLVPYIEENLAMEVKKWMFKGFEQKGRVVSIKGDETLGPEYALALGLSVRGWM